MKNEIYVEEYNSNQGCFHRHLLSEACKKNLEALEEGNFGNNWPIFAFGTAEECDKARVDLIDFWGEERVKKYLNTDLV